MQEALIYRRLSVFPLRTFGRIFAAVHIYAQNGHKRTIARSGGGLVTSQYRHADPSPLGQSPLVAEEFACRQMAPPSAGSSGIGGWVEQG